MRKSLLILAIAAGLMLTPSLSERSAKADVWFSIGSAFSVGGLDFTLVLGEPLGPYADLYFFRTHRTFNHPGYRCHGGCLYRAGYYYHHPDCAVVRHHFRRHSFYPERYLGVAPWYYRGGYRYDRHRYDHRRYDRYRYDRYRYDRYRYDQYRYDRRDHRRYDNHRHDRGRGHRDRYYSDRGRDDHRRDGYRDRHDRGGKDRYDSRRRGSDTRSRGRRH